MLHKESLVHLKWMCHAIVAGTGLFSVWANVLHIVYFSWPALLFAAAPPLVVILSFEMNSRIPIRDDAAWYVKWARPLVTAAISFGGAWLSYWHQKSAILRYNSGDEQNAAILPLLIDGFMIIASVCVYELNARIRAIEAKKAGVELAKTRVMEDKPKPLTGRERIAMAFMDMPWATAKEIAAKAEVKENYASTVLSELRKAQRPNGHTAVPVAN